MDLLTHFQVILSGSAEIKHEKKLLVAVSGGIDSVVLCHLLYKCNIDYVMAHCNFNLRGQESERDEMFVTALANELNRPMVVRRFSTKQFAEENKLSIQEAARQLRYGWFNQLVVDKTADKVTTAHHADDNIETVVMNFFRGTGLKGLTGMETNPFIFRPLINIRKHEILQYARQNKLDHVEDSSNASNKYTRNLFRNILLPAVKEVFPAVEENILENIKRLGEVEQVYDNAISLQVEKLVEIKGEEEHIPILKLKKLFASRTVLWEILKRKNFSAKQTGEVIKLFDAENGSYVSSNTHRIIKNRKWLIVTVIEPADNSSIVVIDKPAENIKRFKSGDLLFEWIDAVDFSIPADITIACFDGSKVSFPLILRKWKQGDYFYPLGMRKKKKLSRFFIDQKLSLPEKEKMRVLEMNKKIIWVVGKRIDDRFKIEENCKQILRVSVIKQQ